LIGAAPLGVLTGADRHNVEIGARLLMEFRADPVEMPTSRVTLLNRILGQFGMSPSDRAKLSVPQPKPENPFSQL
jgi:hypothetical protein